MQKLNERAKDLERAKELLAESPNIGIGSVGGHADIAWSGLEEEIAFALGMAREEGRQEERRRCAAVVAESRVTWDKELIEAIVNLINTPSQEQTHDPEAQVAPGRARARYGRRRVPVITSFPRPWIRGR